MTTRLAVLVDAENMAAKHWPRIRDRIAKLGTTTTCRVFGNLTEERLAGWLRIAQDEAIQPVLQFSGANACDIAIAVSAMDLLHSAKFEGMCLVSSDGDFTSLVHRLRSAGLRVYGFGNTKSAPSLKKACNEFVTVAELNKPEIVSKAA
ncbi:MAG: NYN domain-containing protein [Devosia sp.]